MPSTRNNIQSGESDSESVIEREKSEASYDDDSSEDDDADFEYIEKDESSMEIDDGNINDNYDDQEDEDPFFDAFFDDDKSDELDSWAISWLDKLHQLVPNLSDTWDTSESMDFNDNVLVNFIRGADAPSSKFERQEKYFSSVEYNNSASNEPADQLRA